MSSDVCDRDGDQPPTSNNARNSAPALWVILLAFANYGLSFAISVVLARALGVLEFGQYSAAVAAVVVAATIVTLGMEKLALRELPAAFHKRDWQFARGFVLMGFGVTLVCSVVLATITIAALWITRNWNYPQELGIAMFFYLPCMALFMFCMEVCTARAQFVLSSIIYRLLIPGLWLIGAIEIGQFSTKDDALTAVNIFGISWIVGLAMMLALMFSSLPSGIWGRSITIKPRLWISNSLGFVQFSAIMSIFVVSPILLLGLSNLDDRDTGEASAILQVGGLLLLISTSTSRIYSQRLGVLLAAQDFAGQARLLRNRMIVMSIVGAIGAALTIAFDHKILALFGEAFQTQSNRLALDIYVIGVAVTLVFGFAPVCLQFYDRHAMVLKVQIVFVISTILAMAAVMWMWSAVPITNIGVSAEVLGLTMGGWVLSIWTLGNGGLSTVLWLLAQREFKRRARALSGI